MWGSYLPLNLSAVVASVVASVVTLYTRGKCDDLVLM